MNDRAMPRACARIVLAAALAASLPASAQGKDDLWEVATKMEMPGMPMAMPGQTRRVCVGKNQKDDAYVPMQGDCRLVEGKRTGDKYVYRMDCAGKDPSTVDGAITFGNNAYDGKMHITMKQTGDAMDMTFAGKRVGDCAAATK